MLYCYIDKSLLLLLRTVIGLPDGAAVGCGSSRMGTSIKKNCALFGTGTHATSNILHSDQKPIKPSEN